MDKRGIRALGKALREEAFLSQKDFEEKIYDILSETDFYKKAKNIMVYLNIREEAPTKALAEKMICDGKKVCVPVINEKTLMTAEIGLDTEYKKGKLNTLEPISIREIKKEEIDIVLVPGLLFSEKGQRCGYGGGYYDRFLENASSLKIGLAFEKQVIKSFPSEKYDIKMDFILTEKGLISCEK